MQQLKELKNHIIRVFPKIPSSFLEIKNKLKIGTRKEVYYAFHMYSFKCQILTQMLYNITK